MDFNRRSFLKGALVAGAATLIGGVSILDAEREVGKTLYFFPSEVKLTSSYSDSQYFVRVDEVVPKGQKFSTRLNIPPTEWNKYGDGLLIGQQEKTLRREIYDRQEFYKLGGRAFPLKVEYKEMRNPSPYVQIGDYLIS